MQVQISQWGNSLGVRIPKGIADDIGLKAGSRVEIAAEGDRVVIRQKKAKITKYKLEDLLANTTPEEYRNALDPEFREFWQTDFGREIIDE
jgi:antitoxin MazE